MATNDAAVIKAFAVGLSNDAKGPTFVPPNAIDQKAYAALSGLRADIASGPNSTDYKLHPDTIKSVAKLMDRADLDRLADPSISDAGQRDYVAAASYVGTLFRQAQRPGGMLSGVVDLKNDPFDVRANALGDLMQRAGTTSLQTLGKTIDAVNRYSDKSRYGLTLATEANTRDRLWRFDQIGKSVGAKGAADFAERLADIEKKAGVADAGREAVKLLLDGKIDSLAKAEKQVADAPEEVDSRGNPIGNRPEHR